MLHTFSSSYLIKSLVERRNALYIIVKKKTVLPRSLFHVLLAGVAWCHSSGDMIDGSSVQRLNSRIWSQFIVSQERTYKHAERTLKPSWRWKGFLTPFSKYDNNSRHPDDVQKCMNSEIASRRRWSTEVHCSPTDDSIVWCYFIADLIATPRKVR